MSNLYKQRYVVTNGNGARIINSNALVEEKMQALEKQLQSMQQSVPDNDGFVAGLNMEAVDVIPKEEMISVEEMLEQKSREAEEILENANRQANEVLTEAKEQAETVRQQAKEEGYQQGISEGRQQAQEELEELRQQLEAERREQEAVYRSQLEELEPKLVDVIADVFEQVFHVQFDDKKDILIYLVQNTILGIEGAKDFQIKVGIDDFAFLESHMEEVKEKVGHSVNLELMADSAMKEGQCVIETDSGVFECGKDIQLENLIKALRSLSLRG